MLEHFSKKYPETLKRISLEIRAVEKLLDDELSIKDIAKLFYTNDKTKQNALVEGIIAACKSEHLKYYGDINGWSWGGKYGENPYPKISNGKSNEREIKPGDNYLRHYCYQDYSIYSDGGECLIHRDEFKSYLTSNDMWPINNCLLSNWWCKSDIKSVTKDHDEQPWEIKDPNDPNPKQPWFTPARYFAREYIKEDSTLLTKKDILEQKVVHSLNNANIKNTRRGKFKVNGNVKKAFVNLFNK